MITYTMLGITCFLLGVGSEAWIIDVVYMLLAHLRKLKWHNKYAYSVTHEKYLRVYGEEGKYYLVEHPKDPERNIYLTKAGFVNLTSKGKRIL